MSLPHTRSLSDLSDASRNCCIHPEYLTDFSCHSLGRINTWNTKTGSMEPKTADGACPRKLHVEEQAAVQSTLGKCLLGKTVPSSFHHRLVGCSWCAQLYLMWRLCQSDDRTSPKAGFPMVPCQPCFLPSPSMAACAAGDAAAGGVYVRDTSSALCGLRALSMYGHS